jgi:hypothetical protein
VGRLRHHDERFELDDRLLARLQIVVGSELPRSGSFLLSRVAATDVGSGRHAVWIETGARIPHHLLRQPTAGINRQWVEELATVANSTGGLVLMDEPASREPPPGRADLERPGLHGDRRER